MAQTFRVALVRVRGRHGRLQALRRRVVLVVDYAQLRVGAEGAASLVAVAKHEVARVQVKGRLLRVHRDAAALTVRFESAQDAVNAATAIMDAFGIDPEIQTQRGEADAELEELGGVGQVARQFLASPELRRAVHEMHELLERLLAEEQDGGHTTVAV